MRGFADVQASNMTGRIDGSGSTSPADRGSVSDYSQLPTILEIAYDVARRTSDDSKRTEIYSMMRKYLDWWLSPVKRDAKTGLVSAIFEETIGEFDQFLNDNIELKPQTLAPVDTNVVIAIGARRVSEIARWLGRTDESQKYWAVYQGMCNSINKYFWNEEDGVYYNYDLVKGVQRRRLIVSIFDPLRLGIASAAQRDRLLSRLLEPSQFNWGKVPLTSMAMTDPNFVEAPGNYDGRAWLGNVWTLRNMVVIKGLEDSARPDLAAELNWATIRAFHNNYYENLLPSSGQGEGAKRYCFTASQYIEAIIEHLFGVDFDAIEKRVRIAPHVPHELYGQEIALDDLILPTGGDTRLSVQIRQSSPTAATIRVTISGSLPKGDLLVVLPGTAKENRVPMQRSFTAKFE